VLCALRSAAVPCAWASMLAAHVVRSLPRLAVASAGHAHADRYPPAISQLPACRHGARRRASAGWFGVAAGQAGRPPLTSAAHEGLELVEGRLLLFLDRLLRGAGRGRPEPPGAQGRPACPPAGLTGGRAHLGGQVQVVHVLAPGIQEQVAHEACFAPVQARSAVAREHKQRGNPHKMCGWGASGSPCVRRSCRQHSWGHRSRARCRRGDVGAMRAATRVTWAAIVSSRAHGKSWDTAAVCVCVGRGRGGPGGGGGGHGAGGHAAGCRGGR